MAVILVVGSALAGPDLRGYNGAFSGGASYPFDVQESAVNWGDQVHVRFAVANFGNAAAGFHKTAVFISDDTTIGDANDYRLLPSVTAATVNPSGGYYVNYGDVLFQLPSTNPLPGSPSTVYFGMVIDVDGQVTEDNESNNRNLGNTIDRDDTPLTITPPVPDIFASDSVGSATDLSIAFTNVAVDGPGNARGVQTVTLMNKGKADLSVSHLTMSGNATFSIVDIASSSQHYIQPSSLPRTLAANGSESWVITVQFDPTVLGAATGTLTINSTDPDTPALSVSLSGTGVSVPDIAREGAESDEVDFGSVVQDGVGGFSEVRTVTLKNLGTGPLTVNQNGITMLTGAQFSMLSITSSTRGAISLASASNTIAAESAETWAVHVRFDPTATGQQNDGLRVFSNDPDESTFVVSLRGRGASPMQLAVTDSQGSPTDRSITFPDTHADGTGLQAKAATVLLKNHGEAPLTVASNGIGLVTGTHFRVQSLISSIQGSLNLATGSQQIAGATSETWTATIAFDPVSGGSLGDTLRIVSDDMSSPTTTVALAGQGVTRAALVVTDSAAPADDQVVAFGAALADGIGGLAAVQTLTLVNVGTEPLVIVQNGLPVSGGSGFVVTGVVSSTRGVVDLASALAADRTIAATQTETWVVHLAFDPSAAGAATGVVQVLSNDPVTPSVTVALSGTGSLPGIVLISPDTDLNVAAGSVFNLRWTDDYPAGDARIGLFLATATNPVSGLIGLATNLSEDDTADAYAWRVSESLTGGQYYVYATIEDGPVTNSSLAAGRLTVDALGAFKLRSPVEVTSPDYAYEYEYNGQVYQGVTHLQLGDNIVTVSNPRDGGGTASFQFTVRLVPSLIHAENVAHDELNRIDTVKNGNGIETRLVYDPMNSLIRRESDNGAVVEFGYDVLGRRTNMVDATGTTFYEFDDLDRLTAVITSKNGVKGDSDDLALRYEYDLVGRKTAIVYPGGERIQYTYDGAGRMLSVTNVTRNLGFQYSYNPSNGLMTKLARPNGIDTLYSYDIMGRLTNILHQKTGGQLMANFGYTLDAAGKATEFRTTETGGVQRVEQYIYDRFDRLANVLYSEDGTIDVNDKAVSYTYDGNGNRLSMTTRVNNAVSEVRLYQYGNENRLLRITDGAGNVVTEFDYDAAGNTIQETTAERTRFFSYDERNLLVGMVDGTNHVEYAYNGDGQRLTKTVNGETTRFVNDINRPIWETVLDLHGTGTQSFTFGERRLAEHEVDATRFELADRIGSVRRVSDDISDVVGTSEYEVFGTAIQVTGVIGNNQFAGERRDAETGWTFLRARVYAMEAGRFMSKDPLGINAGQNGYLYCGGDPINRLDPTGMVDWDAAFDASLSLAGNVAKGVGATVGLALLAAIPEPLVSKIAAAGPIYTAVEAGYGTLTSAGNLVAAFREDPIVSHGSLSKDLGKLWFPGNETVQNAIFLYEAAKDVKSFYSLAEGGALKTVLNVPIAKQAKASEYIVKSAKYGSQAGEWLGSAGELSSLGYDGISRQDIISLRADSPLPGGVLLDKAAQLVGSNLSDIRGAVYDPITGQFVFLGTEGAAGVKDINLDYLYTALQAVYGSAVPPFVTLDPPATIRGGWSDYGDGDGVFEPGERGGFMLRYTPRWSGEDHEMRIRFKTQGVWYTAVMDAIQVTNIYAGGQYLMVLDFNRWDGSPPAGVSWVEPTGGGIWIGGIYCGTSISAGPDGQDTFYPIVFQNSGAQNHLIEGLSVLPDRQHRKFGGRVEGSQLGWVMLEADRVMKCLTVGRDNLRTNITYSSGNVAVPGYSNIAERLVASDGRGGNVRFWFTPNEMTLKRHLDPATGRASIIFDRASVSLNTESYMMGLPQPPEARAFADHFTTNYDAFAAISFPCIDPNDPASTNIVQVKIFERLREAMQAMALARFFRDNNVPVDMWWLNSWTPPVAYSPKSVPTAYHEQSGLICYGGVQVNKPNTYVPSSTAKSVADVVQASHPDLAGNPGGDLKEQVWTNSTDVGTLRAVAAQTDAEPQDGNFRLAELDLNFASPEPPPKKWTVSTLNW